MDVSIPQKPATITMLAQQILAILMFLVDVSILTSPAMITVLVQLTLVILQLVAETPQSTVMIESNDLIPIYFLFIAHALEILAIPVLDALVFQ
jgi:hypothetical protein